MSILQTNLVFLFCYGLKKQFNYFLWFWMITKIRKT